MTTDLEAPKEDTTKPHRGRGSSYRVVLAGAPSLELPKQENHRRTLLFVDAIALLFSWSLVRIWSGPAFAVDPNPVVQLGTPLLVVVSLTAITLLALAGGKLYRARVCALRSSELRGLAHAVFIAVVALVIVGEFFDLVWQLNTIAVGGGMSLVCLAIGRAAFRGWLAQLRRRGEAVRPLLLVGANSEASKLYRVIQEHPEQGLEIRGVVGDKAEAASHLPDVSWLGDVGDIEWAVAESGVNGVMVAASALPQEVLNTTVRRLVDAGLHVQVSSGLLGIGAQRFRKVPVAHEPLFYLEPMVFSTWQVWSKRVFDVVLASVILVLASPLMAAAAGGIKWQDRGPVLFRQERVGRDGKCFTLLKFRTMVIDAQERLKEVEGQNQRDGGPLFKLAGDPRVTAIGRFMRATSIDELPQLLNVLRGEMSLVGPRPALPQEVAAFSARLRRERHRVLPGITGLWQLEARENPSFWSYERLDLFYVENWSVGLDLSILAGTSVAVLRRGLSALRLLRPRRGEAIEQPAPVLE